MELQSYILYRLNKKHHSVLYLSLPFTLFVRIVLNLLSTTQIHKTV